MRGTDTFYNGNLKKEISTTTNRRNTEIPSRSINIDKLDKFDNVKTLNEDNSLLYSSINKIKDNTNINEINKKAHQHKHKESIQDIKIFANILKSHKNEEELSIKDYLNQISNSPDRRVKTCIDEIKEILNSKNSNINKKRNKNSLKTNSYFKSKKIFN